LSRKEHSFHENVSYHHMGWGKKKSNLGNSWIQTDKGKGKGTGKAKGVHV